MRVPLGVFAVTLALAAFDVECTSARTCIYTTFEQQIERADLIFVGTVASDTSVWVPCSPVGTDTCTIATKYRFVGVTYLKGKGQTDSLILLQEGGSIGDLKVHSGEVQFALGSRYVVLAQHSKLLPDHYSTSQCGLGPFGILPDSSREGAVVHVRNSPLVAFDGTHMVGLISQPWSPDYGVWEVDNGGARRPPSRRPLSQVIQASDAELRSRMEGEGRTQEQIEEAAKKVRGISLYPHQDPGNRVSEKEFLRALASVIKRVEEAPAKE